MIISGPIDYGVLLFSGSSLKEQLGQVKRESICAFGCTEPCYQRKYRAQINSAAIPNKNVAHDYATKFYPNKSAAEALKLTQ